MKAAGLLSLDLEVTQCHFHRIILVKTSHQPVRGPYGKRGKVTFQRNRQGGVIGNGRVKIFEISSRELFFKKSIETCIISYKKQIASPGLMQDTRCLGLVHWGDPEGWYGEGSGRRGFRMGNTCTPVEDSC